MDGVPLKVLYRPVRFSLSLKVCLSILDTFFLNIAFSQAENPYYS